MSSYTYENENKNHTSINEENDWNTHVKMNLPDNY